MDAINALLSVQSWPQVIVVALGLGFLAWRQWLESRRTRQAIEETKTQTIAVVADNTSKTEDIQHEMYNNSGSSLRDAIDRIEQKVTGQGNALDAHIVEAKGRDEADQAWRTQVEDLLTRT